MSKKLKFSVIIPSYNSSSYIQRNLESLINSSIDKNNLEIIVIDDGTHDDSVKNICDNYRNNNIDINLIYIWKENGNWGSVINYVKNNKLANGEIISILDSDDFYVYDVFKIIEENIEGYDMIVGNFRKFDGKKIKRKVHTHLSLISHKIKNKFSKISPYCLPLPFFFKKEIFYKTNDLIEGIAYQDGDLITQLLSLSMNVKYVNKVLGYYYFNRVGNSMSAKWEDKRVDALIKVCYKCINNGCQEQVVYKMFANLSFRKALNLRVKENKLFIVTRKFNFNWFPIYIRWIFIFLYRFKYKKYFINVNKKSVSICMLLSLRHIINFFTQSSIFKTKFVFKLSKKMYYYIFNNKGIKNAEKRIVEIDILVRPILKKYNGYLGCGNCLFLARNQTNFSGQDIDYCVQNIVDISEFICDCEHIGLKLKSKLFYEDEIIEIKFDYIDTYIDFFLLTKLDEKFVISRTILLRDSFPKIERNGKGIILSGCDVVVQKWTYTYDTIEKEMYNHKFLIPKNYDEYLTWQYGNDWRVPRSNFDFFDEPKNNMPIIYKGKGTIIY